jgi:hypothetical protein
MMTEIEETSPCQTTERRRLADSYGVLSSGAKIKEGRQ